MPRLHSGKSAKASPDDLADLRSEFLELAGRAPWVRATFILENGKIVGFALGRPHTTAESAYGIFECDLGFIRDVDAHEKGIIEDLYTFTFDAGTLAVTISQPRETPADLIRCWLGVLRIRGCARSRKIDEGRLLCWVDNYAQASASSLIFLRKALRELKGRASPQSADGGIGGKPPMEDTHPVRFQVYDRIHRERQLRERHLDLVKRLKADKGFVEQVAEAGLRLDPTLVRKALSFFRMRSNRKRNK